MGKPVCRVEVFPGDHAWTTDEALCKLLEERIQPLMDEGYTFRGCVPSRNTRSGEQLNLMVFVRKEKGR